MDQANEKFIRFPGFSGNHGWQWSRRIYNLDSSVWAYNLNKNKWINMRPIPEILVGPARVAAYDTDNQIILAFNVHESSKTAAYDLYTNTWTLLNPKDEPPEKQNYNPGFNMSYDQSQKLFILFGVGNGDDPRTFTFDIKKNEWKNMQSDINPTYYRADPVLAYDNRNKITICVAQNNENNTLETWTYDAGLNQWRKMNPDKEPDPAIGRQRSMTYSPDQNLIILENRYSPGDWRINEQQIWTYRYAEAQREKIPDAPVDLQLETTKNSIELSWKSKSKNFNVYHEIGEKPWLVDYKKIASVKTNNFVHKNPKKDKINYYYVTAIDSDKESKPSLKIRSQPRVITDIIVSALSKDKVEIEWRTEDKDILGYNIYRAKTEFYNGFLRGIGSFEKINESIIKQTKSIDNIFIDKVYAYRVHAVNNLGIESGPSPYILTIPSPPQYVFSKEDVDDCHLKWKKNPEKNIIGYNVYRTRDRNDDDLPIINKELIKTTHFTDFDAKQDMPRDPPNIGRRYYVTAVDKLGQESFPSAPVWFYREWHKFYKLEVWHQ